MPAFANEPSPVGVTIIDYGIFDSDGNNTHELTVGQKYDIKVHFKSDLNEPVSFTYFIQIIDKDKHWSETVEEFRVNGLLQPHEDKFFAFEWAPEYEGRFWTFSEVGNTISGTTIGGVPQYDFEVVSSSKQTTSSVGTIPDLTKQENPDESYSDPQHPFIRIPDETFGRQNLLTGKPIEDTDSFVGMTYAYAGIGFLALVIGFFGVKKIKSRNKIDSRKLKKSKKNSQHKK